MINKWSKIVQKELARCLPLPCRCLLCIKPTKRNIVLCHNCEQTLPFLAPSVCRRCALAQVLPNTICEKCSKNPPAWDRLHALFDYRWPLDCFMLQFKYKEHLYFANLLGTLMAQHLPLLNSYDCLVPIPLHSKRQRERGFNQTLELAKVISTQTKIPIDRWSAKRIYHALPQSSLSAKVRKQNIHPSAFAISAKLKGKNVLVIEDVVTTGSTIQAFCQALLQKGVKKIDIWACCRTSKI